MTMAVCFSAKMVAAAPFTAPRSVEGGWDFRGTKPHVCRLFPVSYESDAIVLSDDYSDYSCALDDAAPTLYRVARADLGDIFGRDLVVALDAAESRLVSEPAPLLQVRM